MFEAKPPSITELKKACPSGLCKQTINYRPLLLKSDYFHVNWNILESIIIYSILDECSKLEIEVRR